MLRIPWSVLARTATSLGGVEYQRFTVRCDRQAQASLESDRINLRGDRNDDNIGDMVVPPVIATVHARTRNHQLGNFEQKLGVVDEPLVQLSGIYPNQQAITGSHHSRAAGDTAEHRQLPDRLAGRNVPDQNAFATSVDINCAQPT